jgi:hypothetical protein
MIGLQRAKGVFFEDLNCSIIFDTGRKSVLNRRPLQLYDYLEVNVTIATCGIIS